MQNGPFQNHIYYIIYPFNVAAGKSNAHFNNVIHLIYNNTKFITGVLFNIYALKLLNITNKCGVKSTIFLSEQ